MSKRRVVILGGGLASVTTARAVWSGLRPAEREQIEIVVISSSDQMVLSSSLAQVAAGGPPHLAAAPLRACLGEIELICAEVEAIDPATKTLTLDGASIRSGVLASTLSYDELVLALGTGTSFRDAQGAETRALPLTSLQDALRLRSRILDSLAAADAEDSPRRRRSLLTTLVVGAGASGCQLAGELLGFFRRCLPLFPRVRHEDLQVILVDREPSCLSNVDAKLGERARDALVRQGVTLRLGAEVVKVEDDHVILRDRAAAQTDSARPTQVRVDLRTLSPILPAATGTDERVDARIVAWTPRGHVPAFLESLGTFETGGRIPVDATLRSAIHEGLWVIGDVAAPDGLTDRADDRSVRQARAVAANVVASLRKLTPKSPRTPWIRASSLGPVGVASVLGVSMGGVVGAWIWSSMAALRLPGWRLVARTLVERSLEILLPFPSSGAVRFADSPTPLFLTPFAPPIRTVIPAIPRPLPSPAQLAAATQPTQPSPGTDVANALPPISTTVNNTVPAYPASVPPTIEGSPRTERLASPRP